MGFKDMVDKTVFNELYKPKFGRTICEVHREIYDIFCEHLEDHEKFDEMSDKLNEAYQMAKKMDAKLRQYKNNYDDNWWEQERLEVIKEKINSRVKRTK